MEATEEAVFEYFEELGFTGGWINKNMENLSIYNLSYIYPILVLYLYLYISIYLVIFLSNSIDL